MSSLRLPLVPSLATTMRSATSPVRYPSPLCPPLKAPQARSAKGPAAPDQPCPQPSIPMAIRRSRPAIPANPAIATIPAGDVPISVSTTSIPRAAIRFLVVRSGSSVTTAPIPIRVITPRHRQPHQHQQSAHKHADRPLSRSSCLCLHHIIALHSDFLDETSSNLIQRNDSRLPASQRQKNPSPPPHSEETQKGNRCKKARCAGKITSRSQPPGRHRSSPEPPAPAAASLASISARNALSQYTHAALHHTEYAHGCASPGASKRRDSDCPDSPTGSRQMRQKVLRLPVSWRYFVLKSWVTSVLTDLGEK
jgi:hypothetical protein